MDIMILPVLSDAAAARDKVWDKPPTQNICRPFRADTGTRTPDSSLRVAHLQDICRGFLRLTEETRGNTGYTVRMAKVMISLPDEFLARVDAQANAHGSTRSATIRELAEVGLGERQRRLSEQMSALEGTAREHGGHAVRDLKAGRPR